LGLCHDPAVSVEPASESSGPIASPRPGRTILLVDTVGTALFALTAALEAVLLRPWTETVGIAVALGLFLVGCLAFFAGYLGASSAAAPTRSASSTLSSSVARPRLARSAIG